MDPEQEIRKQIAENPDKELSKKEILELFMASRNAALLSLNEWKIRNFYRFWNNEEMPHDKEVFWRGVHKAITSCKDLPIEARQRSKFWLNTHGSESMDDGEL